MGSSTILERHHHLLSLVQILFFYDDDVMLCKATNVISTSVDFYV